MRNAAQGSAPRGTREILEEAIALIRGCVAAELAGYCIGTLPFVMALLFFLHDMRYDAFADEKLGAAALGLTLLYLWMKCWQAIFARQISGRLAASREPLRLRDLWSQAAIQPTSLFVLPLAFLLVLPYGWVYSYYQSLTVVREPAAARHHALLWPRQNHFLLLILTAFRTAVFLNILLVLMAAPQIVKAISGLETTFTRNPMTMFNTTLLSVAVALTYLAVGPIGIAIYAVRCYYGETLRTGHDLRVELKRLSRAATLAFATAITLPGFCAAAIGTAVADVPPAEAAASTRHAIDPAVLGRSIDAALQEREFAWQLNKQRGGSGSAEKGLIAGAMLSILETINGWARAVGEQIVRFVAWLVGQRNQAERPRPGGFSWGSMARVLVAVLLVTAIVALILLSRRRVASRRADLLPGPDTEPADLLLASDHEADRIASDRWMREAKDLLAGGDLRGAMRAVYMAILSHLARGGALALAPAKTNRDYQRELLRRFRAMPELPEIFSNGVDLFERVWYGHHRPTREQLQRLESLFSQVQSRVEI